MADNRHKVADLDKKLDVLRLCPLCVEFMAKEGLRQDQQIADVLLGETAGTPESRAQMWSRMKTGKAVFGPEQAVRLFKDVLGIADRLNAGCMYFSFDEFRKAVEEAGLQRESTIFGGFYGLWRQAESWDGLQLVTRPNEVRGGFSGDDNVIQKTLRVGEQAAIIISPGKPGHLVLIECGPKAITCLVPSARQPKTEFGETGFRLPREGYIKIGTQGGAPIATYWLIAAITTERPKLPSWTEYCKSASNQGIPALSIKQQTELADILGKSPDLRLYQNHYSVVDPLAVPSDQAR